MSIRIYTIIITIITLLALSKGASTGLLVMVGIATAINITTYILYAKKKINETFAVLLSGLGTAVWLTEPSGILAGCMPVYVLLYGGVIDRKGEPVKTRRWSRIVITAYSFVMYVLRIYMFGSTETDVLLFTVITLFFVFSGNIVRRQRQGFESIVMAEIDRSSHDPLTGLMNREHMDAKFAEYSQLLTGFSVIMMDIDNFKKINDKYGHVEGDRILRELADTIRMTVRNEDATFRYGGEEFLIMCPGANKKIAGEIAERIRVNFNQLEHQYDNGESVCFSISVGVAEYLYGDQESLRELVEKADKAMYTAKRTGKNKVEVWDPLMKVI